MEIIKKALAGLLAALMLLGVCACGKRGNNADPTPAPTKAPYTDPDAADEARILELAAAFERFGEIDPEEGVTVNGMEYMIYCWYCDKLVECETADFGKVPFGEADKMVCSVFGSDDIKLVLRTKFDPTEDQNYYALNDHYYVRIAEPEYEYRISKVEPLENEDGAVVGTKATVDALSGGEVIISIVMGLGRNSEGQYFVRSCSFFQNI